MDTEKQNGVASDVEASEKPVREQLQKAAISEASGQVVIADDGTISRTGDTDEGVVSAEANEARGRAQRKRSPEHFEAEEAEEAHPHTASRSHNRKRSRDSTTEEHQLNDGQRKSFERGKDPPANAREPTTNGHPKPSATERPRTPEQTGEKRSEAAVDEMTSPKIKRSRTDAAKEADGAEVDAFLLSDKVEETTEVAPEETPRSSIPSTSGFANTSVTSPFASLPQSKSPPAERPTSPSAFAASGFSSLVGSSSGFGAVGKTTGGFGTGGGFATGSKSPFASADSHLSSEKTETSTSTASPFGGLLGQQSSFSSAGNGTSSAFGSTSSGFGKLGGGLATGGFGGLGGGTGLSSFASGKPSAAIAGSSKPAKPFGAAADEEEEAEDAGEEPDESGFKSPLSQGSDKQDERFYEQELETGEEDEFTEYSCRAKLYNYGEVAEDKKEWKERGLGVVRLNVRKAAPGEDSTKPKARLLMRAEGSHRVILNTPVKKEIKFGTPTGAPPTGPYVFFMGSVDGKATLEFLQLKVRQQFATELCEKISELQATM